MKWPQREEGVITVELVLGKRRQYCECPFVSTARNVLSTYIQSVKAKKVEVHPCTETEALYRPYGP